METSYRKPLSSLVIAFLLLLTCLAVVPSAAQAAWYDSSTMRFAPSEFFAGESYEASYRLNVTASQGVTQITITQVLVQYGWEDAATTLSVSEDMSSFPSERVFTRTVSVPGSIQGQYTVNVTVVAYINGDASTTPESTTTYRDNVVVSATELQATAQAEPLTGQAPQAVNFTASPSGGSGGYTYLWRFGDGKTSRDSAPSHTYAAGGSFRPEVVVTDSLGRSVTVRTSLVEIEPPMTVSITARPNAGPAPVTVNLTSVVENNNGTVTYSWNLGDGATSTEANLTHTYTRPGTFNVNLTVTDGSGRSAVSSNSRIVVSQSPNLSVSIAAPVTSGPAPFTVNLTSVVENGTYPYTYLWDFGDGNTSTDVKPSHTYTTTGIYLAHLTVTDFASRTAASSDLTITVVSGSEMVVGISSDVDSGTTPLSVSFSAEILKGTPEYAYYWSFGDGSNSTLASPTHVFNQTGRFNVTLAVVDANGNVSISNPVSITVSAPSEGLPAWAWIWAGTGISILVVGAVAFVLLWTRKE